MAAQADGDQARKDARWRRYRAESRVRPERLLALAHLVLAPVWVGSAVLRWLDDDADAVSRWLFTFVAAAYVVVAAVLWWRFLRRLPT